MTILTKNFNPGGAGATIPGAPGSPGHPAYCIDVPTTGPSYTYIAVPDNNNPGQYTIIPVTGPNVTTITHECFAATSATPAGPPTIIPSVAANYYTGWNAAADSIATLAADGMFQVSADASAVGIVVGLTPTPVEPGYSGITHGIYFASGTYQYFESGVALTPATAFVSTDVFTIRRLGTQVAYYKGSTLDYTSLQPSTGAVYANASMYFGGDRLLSAAFVTPVTSGFAGIGQRGTFDPALPSSPPPTTYGVPPQYVSVAGRFNGLRDYIANSNLTIVSPGPVPGDPGTGPPDGNGDWPGRSGGTLRELVGVATAYNNGTVTAGPTPPSTGTDPITGDWPGRSGSSLRSLVGQIFGSQGDGTAYSTASGRLTGLNGNAGAALLAPNYVVDAGYLGGMGGFAIALAGMNGVVQGTLPDLEGFATDSTGAYTNPDGPPPSSGGAPVVTTLFQDTFTGTGTFASGHTTPDIGGVYAIDGADPLSNYVLNGSGGLSPSTEILDAASALTAAPSDTYTLAETFTVASTGTATLSLDLSAMAGTIGTSASYLAEGYLVWNGTSWTLEGFISNAVNTTIYDSGATAVTITTGVPQTISVEVTPAGVSWLVNGAVVFSTTTVPPIAPTHIGFTNTKSAGTGSGATLDVVTMTTSVAGAPGTGPPDGNGDWPGRTGGQLRQLVGQIYSFPAPAELFEDNYTGTGTLAVHNPDIGGPYGIVGGGSPSGYVLNGTGGLPSAPTTAGELVSVIAPTGQTYTLTGAFTVPAAGTDTLTLVLGVATTTTGNTLIGAVLTYDGVNTWTLTTTVSNANGTVLYTSSKLVSITGAGTHTIAIVETPGGTTVTIDGIAVAQTTVTPNVPPTSVVIKNVTSGSTSNLVLDVVTMFELPADTGYALVTLGDALARSRYNFAGFGHSDVVYDSHGNPVPYGLIATLGANDGSASYGFAGYGGGNLTYTFSQLVIDASGTLTITGGATALLPLPTLTGSGTTTELGTLAGTLQTRYNTSAYGGGSAAGNLPHGTGFGHGLGGKVGFAADVLPRGFVTASGSVGTVGNAEGILPGLQSTASGVLIATYGGYELRATGEVTVTVEYEAYSITLLQSDQGGLRTATTHYTNYPFDRIVRFGSTYYGVAADGLYELNGADFNGTPIIANVITAETDFGTSAFKRPENLYLGGRVGADMDVSVVSEELGDDTYAYRPVSKDGARTHRVQFGKGIRARFMAFQLTNVNGEDFEIDDMTPEIAKTKRTI